MDIQAAYGSSAGSKETASLCLKGLRAETQIVAGTETANSRLMTNLHGGIKRQGAGITQVRAAHSSRLPRVEHQTSQAARSITTEHVCVQGQLLDPVDVTAAYKNDGAKRDVAVEVTDIALHVAPDAITVVSEVSDTILKPLQAASPAQPLYAVNAYSRIVSSTSKKSLAPPFAAVGAGGLDSIGEERGFTFWAPVAPPGHSILGHVLTAGTSQPTHEVMCAALTSGIVAWPLGFDACWHGVNATVWEPRPPKGYAALGCVVTTGGAAPALQAMVCVHLQALVRAPLGQCLARSGEGSLWAVDNSAGSFVFADEESAPLSTLGVPQPVRRSVGLDAHVLCSSSIDPLAHAALTHGDTGGCCRCAYAPAMRLHPQTTGSCIRFSTSCYTADHLPMRLVYDLRTPLAAAPIAAPPAALPENWAQTMSEHSTSAYASNAALSSFRCALASFARLTRRASSPVRASDTSMLSCMYVLQHAFEVGRQSIGSSVSGSLIGMCRHTMPFGVCRSFQRFQRTWSQSVQDAHTRALSTTTLVFERVWTNKMRANSRQNAISIWRPVPPAGYVAVGDCLVSGSWTAPRSATVLHVERDEHSLVQPAVVCSLACVHAQQLCACA